MPLSEDAEVGVPSRYVTLLSPMQRPARSTESPPPPSVKAVPIDRAPAAPRSGRGVGGLADNGSHTYRALSRRRDAS